MHESIQVARQPILDASLTLRGYELLARDAAGHFPERTPGAVATSQVVTNALAEFGIENVVGDVPAYINITREFAVGELPLPLPPRKVVLELIEDVEPDPEVIRGLERLRSRGFRIAIDDFSGMRPGYDAVLARADVIKVECLGRSVAETRDVVKSLRSFPATILAEKVERHEEFRAYVGLGFALFQGYFFAAPDSIKGRTSATNRANLMQLLAELQDPDRTPEQLERVVARDPALSLKLIRYLNSAIFGLRRKVECLRDVVVYLGAETLRSVASLLLLARVTDKPHQLMVTALIRARMCEELARTSGERMPQRAFTVGLFSALDAMMDRKLDELINDLPLADEISAALVRREGSIGAHLDAVLAHERGDWARVRADPTNVQRAYASALIWAGEMERQLRSATQG